ncbi:hypothetical protein KKF34_00330 [Myxococcota bacterium]|nr:hypothetical protein [Myxococcota bacterium]MBU1380319.1 hypothetical protein [Myxococcota bacterium]MBU1495307.1 hypothetical protein [Myxococcota bacterium]
MRTLLILLSLAIVASCGGKSENKAIKQDSPAKNPVMAKVMAPEVTPDSMKPAVPMVSDMKTDVVKPTTDATKTEQLNLTPGEKQKLPEVTAVSEFDEIARLIAGLKIDAKSKHAVLMKDPDWIKYAERVSKYWDKTIGPKSGIMTKWSKDELVGVHKDAGLLFYPFSGPDFLHAQILFPSNPEIVMIALEPIGTIPGFDEIQKTGKNYFLKLEATLESILKNSFFRTKIMRKQMFNKDAKLINGTLSTLVFFMVRLGNQIEKIERVVINSDGKVVPEKELKWTKEEALYQVKKKRKKGKREFFRAEPVYGNRITYKTPEGKKHIVTYFGMNLSDSTFLGLAGLKKRKDLMTFLNNLPIVTTYVKSASYLMHRDFFSKIRNFILAKTKYYLQDDSGMPIKYMPNDKFDIKFYGTFQQPIKLFKQFGQKDMAAIYGNKKNKIQRLPFGIGYRMYKNESNLQYLIRK